MMTAMNIHDLPTGEQVLQEALTDPAFRIEWERTALARAVAIQLVQYRVEHDLTQTSLAKLLGMQQPAIARLESGDHNPTAPTLQRLSDVLGLQFHVHIEVAQGSKSLVS